VLARLQADAVWAAVLAAAGERGWPVFVVGGTVRDALLGRDSYSLDLAVAGPALAVARSLADRLGGAFYPLDAERDVARVLLWPAGRRRQVDVAGLRAQGIAADLQARDFTVNALALALGADAPALLDPTGGLDDLAEGVLRLAGPRSFDDDPLRVLRLVRMRSMLGLRVAAAAEQAARDAAPTLGRVTPERVRDETLALLALPGCAEALRYAAELGLLGVLYGPADVARLEGALATLETLARWQTDATALPGALWPYRAKLDDYWESELAAGRTHGVLTRAALLLGGCAADEAARRNSLARQRLSQREAAYVVGNWAAVAHLAALAAPDDLLLHRYYRQVGGAGVAGAVLALAAASRGEADEGLLAVGSAALIAWFERYEAVVAPPALLGSEELLRTLGLAPGPRIGQL